MTWMATARSRRKPRWSTRAVRHGLLAGHNRGRAGRAAIRHGGRRLPALRGGRRALAAAELRARRHGRAGSGDWFLPAGRAGVASDTGDLWLVDGGGPSAPAELNRIVPGADYGFPVAADAPDVPECRDEPPAVLLPCRAARPRSHSTRRTGSRVAGDLLVALGGSATLPEPAAIRSWRSISQMGCLPGRSIRSCRAATSGAVSLIGGGGARRARIFRSIRRRGRHAAGRIVVATQEGRVFRARPRTSSIEQLAVSR